VQVLAFFMQALRNSTRPRQIAVLLFEQFSNHCLANAVEPFRAANTLSGKELYTWTHFSMHGGTVRSSSGLPVETASWVAAKPSGGFLFVLPSYGFRTFSTPQMHQVLRAARRRFGLLVGMDTGAWLFAAAGLLEGKRATIHWDEISSFAETFPEVNVVDDRFVLEDGIATCGGATTTIELALELIKHQHGPMFSMEVAALFMHGDRLDLQNPFQRLSSDQLVRSAVALMRRSVEESLPIPEIAARLKTDQRTLERLFREELKATPAKVYKSLRLREVRRLVELTKLSISEIAARCGYQNTSAMTRAYRLEFGGTPQAHRRLLPKA